MRVSPIAVIAAAGLACSRAGRDGHARAREASRTATARVCPRSAHGVVVGPDTIAGLPIHATLGRLRQLCGAGDTMLYDAVGWQAMAWVFPFDGARVTAVQSKRGEGEALRNDEVPDVWTVEGDSVRMPDGELMPRTLGELRARYGFAIVDENISADDVEGPSARSCRIPYLLFALSTTDTARRVPDSARVKRIDVERSDEGLTQYCRAAEARAMK